MSERRCCDAILCWISSLFGGSSNQTNAEEQKLLSSSPRALGNYGAGMMVAQEVYIDPYKDIVDSTAENMIDILQIQARLTASDMSHKAITYKQALHSLKLPDKNKIVNSKSTTISSRISIPEDALEKGKAENSVIEDDQHEIKQYANRLQNALDNIVLVEREPLVAHLSLGS